MMGRRLPLALGAGLLVAAALMASTLAEPAGGKSPGLRLLGPVAELACDIQWIRFQRARLRGDDEHAIRLAESALALDPGSTDGWILAASHLALFRGSIEREPDLERRRVWFRAGMATALRGATVARDPGEVHLWRAAVLLSRADVDPDIDPGGATALIEAAREALAAGRLAGNATAADLESHVP